MPPLCDMLSGEASKQNTLQKILDFDVRVIKYSNQIQPKNQRNKIKNLRIPTKWKS
jgi:hypothetical protein